MIKGPRLFVAPHRLLSENAIVPTYPLAVSSGVNAARNAIREQIKHGADFIKVNADLGGIHVPEISRWHTVEEMKTFVDEAHAWNTRITSHAQGEDAIRVAVLAGYDSIEHGFFMSESTAKEMKKRGTYLIPTLTVFDALFDEEYDGNKYTKDYMEKSFEERLLENPIAVARKKTQAT